MKRFLPIVLCIILIAALTACGNKEATNMVLSGGYTTIDLDVTLVVLDN